MAVISIISGSFCKGESIVERVARDMNYRLLDPVLIDEASKRFKSSRDDLKRSLAGEFGLLKKYTVDREQHLARLSVVLSELVQQDNGVLSGYAAYLIPRSISHVLRVLIIANLDYRVKQAKESNQLSEKQALKEIHADDERLTDASRYFRDKSAFDESQYDVVIPMHDTSVDDAVRMICDYAGSEPLKTTPLSERAARDFSLAARVHLKLIDGGFHNLDVTSVDGHVTVLVNEYVVRLERHQEQIKRAAVEVTGVQHVSTGLGPKYKPPSINPWGNMEAAPPKILLVDDEKDFVHTLSERLQTRNLQSSVVYDGQEALDRMTEDVPDVMVLDLAMPGIDGIETLRRVKKQHPHVEVIILTGHGSEREEQLARELGAFAYLQKPANIDVLARVMKEAYEKVSRRRGEDTEDG
jgi:CheY-like chemotaxis protein